MRKIVWLPLAACAVLMTGCSAAAEGAAPAAEAPVPTEIVQTVSAVSMAETEENAVPLLDLSAYGAAPPRAVWSAADRLDITAAGTYRLTGSLAGRVTVDADGPVTLILEGVALSGESCLDIVSDAPVTLLAAAGTVNRLTDTDAGGEASSAEPDKADASGAVVASKAPLTFTGEGRVEVTAGVNNGVRCKNDLTVDGGALTVAAANNGLKARGTLTVSGGIVRVRSGGDGLAAETARLGEGVIALTGGQVEIEAGGRGLDADDRAALAGGMLSVVSGDDGVRADAVTVAGGTFALTAGCDGVQAATALTITGGALTVVSGEDALRADTVTIAGGTLNLTAAGDGVQADTLLTVQDGTLTAVTGGGGGAASQHAGESFGPWGQQASGEESVSAKGLKSDGDIVITGGVLDLDTADDSVHCAAVCTISGGTLAILSSDDAIHADDMLVIEGGTVEIADCFEGLEAYAVELRGGDVTIRAVNDGINANGPEGGFGWGRQTETVDSLSGSSVSYVRMTGGTVDLVVTGSVSNMGDGVDSNGAFYMEGGVLTVSTFGTYMENGIDTGSGGPVVTGGMVIAGGAATMQEGWSSASTQCCALIYTGTQPAGTTVSITDGDGAELWAVTLEDSFSCLMLSHPGMTAGNTYTVAYGDAETTLDFTSSNIVNSGAGGFGGMGGFGGRPPGGR